MNNKLTSLDRKNFYSPNMIAFFTILFLSIPALLNYSLTGVIMKGYYGGPLMHPFMTIFIQCLVSFLIFIIFRFTKPIKFKLGIYIKSKNLIYFVIAIYLILGVYSYWILWTGIDPLNIPSTEIGVVLSEKGLGWYYLLLYAPLIALFYIKIYTDKTIIKRLVDIAVIVLIIGIGIITRREMMLVAILMWILSFNNFKFIQLKKKHIILLFILFMGITYFSFQSRGVDVQDDFFETYLNSEEFLPVQFSLYLIDQWVTTPDVEDITRLSPVTAIVVGTPYAEINSYELSKNFSHSRFGPTVTYMSTIVLYGWVAPLFILYLFAKFVISVYYKVLYEKSIWAKLFYPFLIIRTLIFIRNGEVTVSLIDLIIFFIFMIPFIVLRTGKEKEIQSKFSDENKEEVEVKMIGS